MCPGTGACQAGGRGNWPGATAESGKSSGEAFDTGASKPEVMEKKTSAELLKTAVTHGTTGLCDVSPWCIVTAPIR